MIIYKQSLGQAATIVHRAMDFRDMRRAWAKISRADYLDGRKVVSREPGIVAVSDGTRYFKA